jgi:hypothetical protein
MSHRLAIALTRRRTIRLKRITPPSAAVIKYTREGARHVKRLGAQLGYANVRRCHAPAMTLSTSAQENRGSRNRDPRLCKLKPLVRLRRWSRFEEGGDRVVPGTHPWVILAHVMVLAPPSECGARGLLAPASRSSRLGRDKSQFCRHLNSGQGCRILAVVLAVGIMIGSSAAHRR